MWSRVKEWLSPPQKIPEPAGGPGLRLSYVVPVYFNQRDTTTLLALLARYAAYHPATISRIQFVVVDDGSPLPLVIPAGINLNITLYRIVCDITWNQCGARNLGAVYAKAPRLILSDSDHYFPEGLLRDIVNSRVPHGTVYKFKRVDQEGTAIKKAMNIFYTSKAVFFQSLGYDEEFSGNYGYEDLYFLDLQKRIGNSVRYFTRMQKIVATEVDRERSYHSLVRDTAINFALYQQKKQLLRGKDPFVSHSRSFLRFAWTLVEERSFRG
jgi:glycosyltransferase involved in cell wall biosynthesis